MIRGQIAASEVVGVSYADDINTYWGIRDRLCSMAAPQCRYGGIYPDVCERCDGCAYGRRLLELIKEGKIKL